MFELGNFGIFAVVDDLVFRKIVCRSNTAVLSELKGISERFLIQLPFGLVLLWCEFCIVCQAGVVGLFVSETFKILGDMCILSTQLV